MAYLWDDYELKNKYELALQDFCPYTEIFQTVNNVSRVNLLYRFSKVKESLDDCFESKEKLWANIGEDGFNTLFHILANIDFFAGISLKDLRMMCICDEICRGFYGIDTSLFEKLSFIHKYKLLSYMFLRTENAHRKNLFFDCLTEFFDVNLNYSEFADTYIIQVNGKEDHVWEGNYTSLELYDLTKELLCDFWVKVEVYWDIPIGIVGDEIYIDRIQII